MSGEQRMGGRGSLFNYTVCFTPDVHSRVVLLFSNNFPCNFGLCREPIKVGTRFSRQTRTSSAYKWVSGKLIWNLARKYTLPPTSQPANERTNEWTNGLTDKICTRSYTRTLLNEPFTKQDSHQTESYCESSSKSAERHCCDRLVAISSTNPRELLRNLS